MIAKDQQLALVSAASRAPSAHNTQPARWRFLGDDRVALYEDMRRRLHVADPEGRDALVGLGAALEGLHLALSEQGLGVIHVEQGDLSQADPAPASMRSVAIATIGRGKPDALAPLVERRRSYRGAFDPAPTEVVAFTHELRDADDVALVTARTRIDDIARLHDECAVEFLSNPAYQAELWEWMRLTPSDPRWSRDGLNADCLALGAVERSAAQLLMRPPVFSLLASVGAAGMLVSEAAQVRSATALVLLHRPVAEDPLLTGRRFYRLWLTITRAGLALCPMSALTDSPRGQRTLHEWLGVPDGRRIINSFRVGVPRGVIPRSARLPAEELLV